MRRRVEVGGKGQAEANESHEGGNRVNDEDGREGVAGARRKVEVRGGGLGEQTRICRVNYQRVRLQGKRPNIPVV